MVSQGVGGHEGYSGTPLWKIQQQNAAQREALLAESLAYISERKVSQPPNVLVDGVTAGGSGKPLARHVLVKCLRKIAERSRIEYPSTGLFANQAPIGLYALFDGQSCAGEPGPAAAEFCAKNFYKKVIDNLAALPPNATSATFVKAALVKSFEDMDREILETQPDVKDGCGAVVFLLVGDHLFSAVLGACEGVLCEMPDRGGAGQALPLGNNQGRCYLPEERLRLQRVGGAVIGDGPTAKVQGPLGLSSSVSRSLGDLVWKRPPPGIPAVLNCIPEIQCTKLSWAEKHPFALMVSKPVSEAMASQELVDIVSEFPKQPRAACGEAAAKVVEKQTATAQCTVVQVWFLPGGPYGGGDEDGGSTASGGGEAPKKKAKVGPVGTPQKSEAMSSSRLRHILVRLADGKPPKPGDKAGKSRPEAEALLRDLIRQLRAELEEQRKKPGASKKPEDLALKSEKFPKLCKQHSDCVSAQKGGPMCGDLGWVTIEAQRKLGEAFRESVKVLRPGELSDIVQSNDGLHIIQRIA